MSEALRQEWWYDDDRQALMVGSWPYGRRATFDDIAPLRAALTQALAERDKWQIRAEVAEEIALDAVRAEAALTEAEHRAERYKKVVVEVASTTYCENGGGCIAEYNAELARAALDTTAGPGGTG